jgi:hypothetical protein
MLGMGAVPKRRGDRAAMGRIDVPDRPARYRKARPLGTQTLAERRDGTVDKAVRSDMVPTLNAGTRLSRPFPPVGTRA